MAGIDLPWESEHVVEWSKCQLQVDKVETQCVATLISHLGSPTEFAIIITVDEEKPPQKDEDKGGFLAKMKSMASSAASSALKAQRAATASNKLNAIFDVRYVLAVCSSVDFKINSSSLSMSWTETGPIIGSEPVFRQIKLSQLREQFLKSLKASVEISIVKLKNELVPNGSSAVFDWLWKYQPIIPLPQSGNQSPAISAAEMLPPKKSIGKLLALTWNVAGLPPPDDNPNNILEQSYSKLKTQLVNFLKTKLCDEELDVFVLSLQEASPLNAKTVMFKSENFGDAWIDFILDCLESADRGCTRRRGAHTEWIKISAIVQVGLVVCAFLRSRKSDADAPHPRVSSPMTCSVKTGTLGLTGNKGSVGLTFNITYPSTNTPLSVSVMNVHLASGDGKSEFRKNELEQIINCSSFNSGNKHFFDSNLCIVNGDLNSRVSNTDTSEGDHIPPDDEILTRAREEAEGFLFCESEVAFPATYKLIPGQEGRLVFFDNRKPGWCDRILFRSNGGRSVVLDKDQKAEKYHPIEYNSIRQIDYSDHTPVFGIFSLGVPTTGTSTSTTLSTAHRHHDDDHAPEVVPSHHPPRDFTIGNDDEQASSDSNDSDLYDKN